MTDVVDGLGFIEEAVRDFLVRRELVVQDLERDLLADARMLRKIDSTHPTLAQLLFDQIVADGLPDQKVLLRWPLVRVHEGLRGPPS
jgi:hypothetical protein